MSNDMRLAVIVPYRDRAEHLAQFVPAVHAFLGEVPHHIYIVEQCDQRAFNRGKLLNTGFEVVVNNPAQLAAPDELPTHVVLHDVDMLPVNVTYAGDGPTHLAGAASQFNYQLPYPEYFGGVTLFPVADFVCINGFNNDFWGWGCEDDDLLDRCAWNRLPVTRVAGEFRSLSHPNWSHDERSAIGYRENHARLRRSRAGQREYDTNGLNTLEYAFRAWVAIDPCCTILKVEL